jgi:hypothetical protein
MAEDLLARSDLSQSASKPGVHTTGSQKKTPTKCSEVNRGIEEVAVQFGWQEIRAAARMREWEGGNKRENRMLHLSEQYCVTASASPDDSTGAFLNFASLRR